MTLITVRIVDSDHRSNVVKYENDPLNSVAIETMKIPTIVDTFLIVKNKYFT